MFHYIGSMTAFADCLNVNTRSISEQLNKAGNHLACCTAAVVHRSANGSRISSWTSS